MVVVVVIVAVIVVVGVVIVVVVQVVVAHSKKCTPNKMSKNSKFEMCQTVKHQKVKSFKITNAENDCKQFQIFMSCNIHKCQNECKQC